MDSFYTSQSAGGALPCYLLHRVKTGIFPGDNSDNFLM